MKVMYKDVKKWQRIRARVLVQGASKRQVMREMGIHWSTLEKMLRYPIPPGYRRTSNGYGGDDGRQRDSDSNEDLRRQVCSGIQSILSGISALSRKAVPKRDLTRLLGEMRKVGLIATPVSSHLAVKQEFHHWMNKVIQGVESEEMIRGETGTIEHLDLLLSKAVNGSLRDRRRAVTVLAHLRGIPFRMIARFLHKSPTQVSRYWTKYARVGAVDLFTYCPPKPKKADSEEIKSAVFSLLHSPPLAHDMNRTSWKLSDLKKCLSQEGLHVSRDVIREIIEAAGYRWRKAKKVLTSHDPEYARKLERITSILSSLKQDERFFSVDEFGPFAVKMKGGTQLVAPGERTHVPQFQKSKGCLIITAALELATNQVTHFYSKAKNTDEMIKLLDILLQQYRDCRKLFLSWDAGSWHASKALYAKVEDVNERRYRRRHHTPLVELAPLPASAQFLNVIESVFSGMARAIIHNSNYGSVEEAMRAIDRYFKERNEYFRAHPKRAGNKIWGKELVPCIFSEAQNCKDPRW
jgi:transposase